MIVKCFIDFLDIIEIIENRSPVFLISKLTDDPENDMIIPFNYIHSRQLFESV